MTVAEIKEVLNEVQSIQREYSFRWDEPEMKIGLSFAGIHITINNYDAIVYDAKGEEIHRLHVNIHLRSRREIARERIEIIKLFIHHKGRWSGSWLYL